MCPFLVPNQINIIFVKNIYKMEQQIVIYLQNLIGLHNVKHQAQRLYYTVMEMFLRTLFLHAIWHYEMSGVRLLYKNNAHLKQNQNQ